MHGGGGGVAVVAVAPASLASLAPLSSLSSFSSLSSLAVRRPVTLVDLPQLLVDLHPLQTQLLHLLGKHKRERSRTRFNGDIV